MCNTRLYEGYIEAQPIQDDTGSENNTGFINDIQDTGQLRCLTQMYQRFCLYFAVLLSLITPLKLRPNPKSYLFPSESI
jgi:hypothetical protein